MQSEATSLQTVISTRHLAPVGELTATKPRKGYLPTLDGWRAIAVMAVILSHDRVREVGLLNTGGFHPNGDLGVDVFFGISGLLICSRLLEEEYSLGRISIKGFYIRRAFRILPPAVLFLFVLGILGATHIYPVQVGEWLGAMFFYRNYTSLLRVVPGSNTYFSGHFWSLSVEEHFYFLLPTLLFLIRRPSLRIVVLALIAFAVVVHRHFAEQNGPMLTYFHTDIRLDGLLLPALCAVALAEWPLGPRLRPWLRFSPLLAFPVIWAVIVLGKTPARFTLTSISIPLILIGTIQNPQTWFSRLLELPPLRFLGRISYSVYLWQQLLFTEAYGPAAPPFGISKSWLLLMTFTLAFALLSYYFLERPMMAIGHRLAPPATPGR